MFLQGKFFLQLNTSGDRGQIAYEYTYQEGNHQDQRKRTFNKPEDEPHLDNFRILEGKYDSHKGDQEGDDKGRTHTLWIFCYCLQVRDWQVESQGALFNVVGM